MLLPKILESGPNTLLAKIDIEQAFHLLPIHPADRHLLTMEWNQSIYIDTCHKIVMHLFRSLWFFVATFDIHIVTEHIAGTNNGRADMLSRNHVTQFLCSNPQATPLPTPLPLPLLCIMSPQGPDWTSSSFRQ